MGANIPSIGNIGDIDLSEAKSKVSSGAAGLALSAISIFSGDDKKKTIMSQLNKAEKSGKQAKSKISETNGKLDKARTNVKDAEGKKGEAETKKTGAEQQQQQANGMDMKSAQAGAQGVSARAKTKQKNAQNAQTKVEQASTKANSKAQQSSARLDNSQSNIQNLISQSQSAASELDSLQGNDGTGSGMHSALSLKTGAEIQDIESKGNNQGNDVEVAVNDKIQQIQSNEMKIQTELAQSNTVAEDMKLSSAEAQQEIQSEQMQAQNEQQQAQADDSLLTQFSSVTKQVATVAQALDVTGTVLNAAGVGVQAAGATTTAAGIGTTSAGGILTGIGATLTAIGIPLIPVFGAGVPVEAAGGTTTAGGVTTTATGGTVTGVGATVTQVGTVLKTTGSTISTTSKVLSTAANVSDAAINVAKGDVTGVISAVGKTLTSSAALIKGVGALPMQSNSKIQAISNFASQHKGILNTAIASGDTIKDTAKTAKDLMKGDVGAALSDGLSAMSNATGMANSKVSDIFNGLSGVAGISNDIATGRGDGVTIALDALATVASFDGAHRRDTDRDGSIFGSSSTMHSDKESTLYKTTTKIKSLYESGKPKEDRSTRPVSHSSAENIK